MANGKKRARTAYVVRVQNHIGAVTVLNVLWNPNWKKRIERNGYKILGCAKMVYDGPAAEGFPEVN